MAAAESKPRVIKGLVIGKTLGKGTFGFVKLGTKQETGHKFALKFLYTNNKNFNEAAVRKEIECMKKIKHKNVVQLLASTMKCKYPTLEGKMEQTCLMVMEYANGGDLYDIIYYAGAMDERMGATYFKQLLDGVGAIHAAGITHRDLKPNNILIDSKFILKITDFGLSHISESDVDPNQKRMKTSWVGTRGYRAPELVLKARYSNQADVFALGVCLFVMLCARQPFKVASSNDPWYKCIATKQFDKYWRSHKSSSLSKNAKDFLQGLMCYQPRERLTIAAAYDHDFMTQELYKEEDLPKLMHENHKLANTKKLDDPDRQKRLQRSAPGEKRAGDNTSQYCEQLREKLNFQLPVLDSLPMNATCIELKANDDKYFPANAIDFVISWCSASLLAVFEEVGPLLVKGTFTIEDPMLGKTGLTFYLQMVSFLSKTSLLVSFEASENPQLVDRVNQHVVDALTKKDYFGKFALFERVPGGQDQGEGYDKIDWSSWNADEEEVEEEEVQPATS